MNERHWDEQLPETLPDNPMHWAETWLEAAIARNVQRNPNAMSLSTVDRDGRPSSRIVLCKAFVADPGYLVFYTNYESRKCREIADQAQVSVVFHWDNLGRQIRLEGLAVDSPADESDAYFATRNRGSQIGAWGSDQSRPIESRDALLQQLDRRAKQVTPPAGGNIARPLHWGGVRIWPDTIELWIEGSDRIHDRARWTRDLHRQNDHAFTPGSWKGVRLQP